MEPLCERVELRDVPIKFYVQTFQHFKIVFKIKFKNQEHMLPGAKTPLAHLLNYGVFELILLLSPIHNKRCDFSLI